MFVFEEVFGVLLFTPNVVAGRLGCIATADGKGVNGETGGAKLRHLTANKRIGSAGIHAGEIRDDGTIRHESPPFGTRRTASGHDPMLGES